MPLLSIAKILLPVDFSAKAEDAAEYAASLARRFKSEVLLLHVLEPPHVDFAMVELPDALETITKVRCEAARTRLEHFAKPCFEGIKVTRKISQGQPAEAILAEAEGVDLVIMPTQGVGRVREFLIGSVTAKVLHDCPCPMLTGVHLEANSDPQDWRVINVLCAIDFGPECEDVLKWGAHLATEFVAKVTVVHAGSEPDASQRLDQCIKAVGLKAATIVTPGEPHTVVTEAAQQLGADLVIIGRGSSVGALGRLRAQAYEIVRKSPCPVLSV